MLTCRREKARGRQEGDPSPGLSHPHQYAWASGTGTGSKPKVYEEKKWSHSWKRGLIPSRAASTVRGNFMQMEVTPPSNTVFHLSENCHDNVVRTRFCLHLPERSRAGLSL